MGWGYIALSIGCAAGMLVLVGCSDSPPAPPAACHLNALAEFPVTVTGDGHFLIPATIDGKDTKLILDTGAFESALFDSSLRRLGIKYSSFSLEGDATGLGGDADVGVASLADFKLGGISYG